MRVLPPSQLLLLTVLLTATSCARSAYERAREADTISAYRDYLRKPAEDDDVSEARQRLAELELVEARRVHTVLAYKRFLEEFGDTAKAEEARALLANLRFQSAQEANTSTAYRQFLRDHPNSAHTEEARSLLADAELRELTGEKDPRRIAAVADSLQDDPRGDQARRQLDEKTFLDAKEKGPAELLSYLDRFPTGRYRDEARTELLQTEIQGLIVSGLHSEARQTLSMSPLGKRLPKLDAEITQAEELARWTEHEPRAQQALASFYLRPADELMRAMGSPDPLDRWEAALELGHHVSVRHLEPLLAQLRSSRSLGVRLSAFDALERIVAALPRRVAELQLTLRRRALANAAQASEAQLVIGVLEELLGRDHEATAAYGQSFDRHTPDPFILLRMAELRRSEGRWLSAAVAARQLALWADEWVKEQAGPWVEAQPLGPARQLCTLRAMMARVQSVLAEARRHDEAALEDLAAFERTAREATERVGARLRDLELRLQARDAGVRICDDGAQQARLKAGEEARLSVLGELARRPDPRARALLDVVLRHDPSSHVREGAARLPGRSNTPSER